MTLPEIDFEKIRQLEGSRHKAFEELCCQLAALEPRPLGAEHYRKGAGADAGVECFTRFADGWETGWQVKYYWTIESVLPGLDESIGRALIKHPKLSTYVVCIPFDLSDSRTGKGATPLEKWQKWRDKWVAEAAKTGCALTIGLWSASGLRERLTREGPEYAGRILYWFNEQPLTRTWFRQKFQAAQADLGSRYTAETNVALPIRQALLGFARDPALHQQIEEWASEIASKGKSAIHAAKDLAAVTTPMPTGLIEALSTLEAALPTEPLPPTQMFPVKTWRDALEATGRALNDVSAWCLKDLPRARKEVHELQNRVYHHLGELRTTLHEVRSEIDSERWAFVNVRQFLIHGDGGIGKSHLLADVTAHQIERGRPAVLILGQKFFLADPWDQIIRDLDLPVGTSTDHFLGALDAAAQAAGVRGLLLFDALNERHGVALWPDRLGGFLKQLEVFPHLGIVLSCRTTYLPHVIPDTLAENILPRLRHHGFGSGDARAYLKVRSFVLPGAPVPAPEFNNPLFLKTCCDALEKDGLREFPRGMTGATAIFSFYRDAVAREVERRLGLEPRRKMVRKAVDALAQAMAESKSEYLSVERAHSLFDDILPSQCERERDLLTQLESEGMLTVEVIEDEDTEKDEAVRFTFQRFSDHVIATRLIDLHVKAADPAAAFATAGPLHPYVARPIIWEMAGVVEALAVQLPERFGRELPDLMPTADAYRATEAFGNSLLWRAQESFTERTLELVDELLGEEEFLPTLLHVATEPNNRFNGRYLHEWLAPMRMPERDAEWSIPIAQLGANDDGPVWTLIDWAWDNGFDVIEDQRAELAGITLCWFLTTSNRIVRDRATKALAALLTKRPILAADLFTRFWEIDDDYLRERLLAAIYGALLQGMMDEDEISILTLAVYTTLFADGKPAVNALIRDHGRGIIEYARWRKCLPAEVDLVKSRPPYRSGWPLEYVPDEVVEQYTQTYRSGARLHDSIVSSAVNDGDFARYVIDYHVGNWSPAPLGTPKLPSDVDIHRAWLSDFQAKASPKAVAAFEELVKKAKLLKGQGPWEKTPEREAYNDVERTFRVTIGEEAWEDFRVRIQGWISNGMYEYTGRSAVGFNRQWARRWVCKQAHDLGWSEALHGEFDNGWSITRDRMSHSIERVGKKYQWLALYELGARLADNCAFIGDNRSGGSPDSYDGESFGSLRDVDPSLLIRNTHDSGWTTFKEPSWWSPILPRLGVATPADRLQWLYGNHDIVDDSRCIDVTDHTGGRWLVLHSFLAVREWSRGDRGLKRDSWARINCIVVKKSALKSLLRKLKSANLGDPHALPHIEISGHHSYIGEYPWHSSFANLLDWVKPGDSFRSLPTAARPTVTEYTCEKSGYDQSLDDTVRVEMPAPWLIRSMGLHLSDGRHPMFVSDNGDIRFFDPAVTELGPHAALVDYNAFLQALACEDLMPVWVIAGEKGVYGSDDRGFGGRLNFTSLYWLEDGQWKRQSHRELELPTTEQVAKMFDGPVPSWVQTR
ncbi:hypothetical protein [Azospirillum aestuarii]|uniref:hypothetical protein n=1 Tax=Azospirillum aestuarii TaxID=2802052 RepID=UPI004054E53E